MGYAYLIAAIGIGLLGLLVVYLHQRRRSQTDSGHSWLSYILLWPLILDADKAKRGDRFLTKREWFGCGVIVLIALLAIFFTPSKYH